MRLWVKIALGLVTDLKKRYKIWNFAKQRMSKYNFETSKWVREMICPMRSAQFKYPREKFTDVYYLDFEEHRLPTHYYYKEYLHNVYGNYMELPPERERIPKIKPVYINLDQGYKHYKGIKYCKEE